MTTAFKVERRGRKRKTLDDLTAERLREVISYDPARGEFIWLRARGRSPKGAVAGCTRADGYMRIKVDKVEYLAHRLAWLYMTGAWPTKDIDHINRNPSDNRWENLREASPQQNCRNSSMRSNNTSGFRGVHYVEKTKKWLARLSVERRDIYLGQYDTPDLASRAYEKGIKEWFGDYATQDIRK